MRHIMLGDLEVSRTGAKLVGRVEENTAGDGIQVTRERIDKLISFPPAAGGTHAEAGLHMPER